MAEVKRHRKQAQNKLRACAGVKTPASKLRVRWGGSGAVTPLGQLAYFIEFLHLTGLWVQWRDSSPLYYMGLNAPGKSDVLGTLRLSILAGRRRYAHVTAKRGHSVNPALLGMGKIISEDALRRALSAMPETEGVTWLDAHVRDRAWPLLDAGGVAPAAGWRITDGAGRL